MQNVLKTNLRHLAIPAGLRERATASKHTLLGIVPADTGTIFIVAARVIIAKHDTGEIDKLLAVIDMANPEASVRFAASRDFLKLFNRPYGLAPLDKDDVAAARPAAQALPLNSLSRVSMSR